MDGAYDLRGGCVDESLQLTDDAFEISRRERAFALILGAVLQQDLAGDVELAWRVAEMVQAAADDAAGISAARRTPRSRPD